MNNDKYLDDLTSELRERDVPGVRIGEILAEAQSHLAESGEPAEQAFGTPAHYADSLVAARPVPRVRYGLVIAISGSLGVLGGMLVLQGIFSLLGWSEQVFGLPGWLLIVVGLICLGGLSLYIRALVDPVIDPRDGREVKFPLGR